MNGSTHTTTAPRAIEGRQPGRKMNRLSSYLNDHLAGSVAALELIDHLEEKLKQEGNDWAAFLKSLRKDITEDQDLLKELIGSLSAESGWRKAAGWLAEKAGRIKLAMDGEKPGQLGLMEALEILALGITGKRMLWSALRAANVPEARWLDLSALERRAEQQLARVDAKRMEAAGAALRRG